MAQGLYQIEKGNPNFSLIVTANGHKSPITGRAPIQVTATLPENLSQALSSTYDQPFSNEMAGKHEKLLSTLRLMGTSTLMKEMTLQVWTGTAPIELDIPLVFTANYDVFTEIKQPIAELAGLMLPSTVGGQGGLMLSPGPRVRFANKSGKQAVKAVTSGGGPGSILDVKNTISIAIGKDRYFDNVVITNVSDTYDIVPDPSGQFMYAQISLQFRTFFTPTVDDIPRMYNLTRGNTNG